MKTRHAAFNIYLLLLAMLLLAGCKTAEERKRSKEASTLRLYLEVNADASDSTSGVPVYRENPIMVTVEQTPFLTEVDLQTASLMETRGGYALRVQFNRHGALLLEGTTASHKGRRIAVQSHFPEARWLGAPLINRRIPNGELVFTPDATREEAERIVRGLTNVVREIRKRAGIFKD